MRANALLRTIILAALAGCKAAPHDSQGSPSPQTGGTPAPLAACETRELTLDGASLVVQSNQDGTVASILVVRAGDDDVRAKAFEDARKRFGDPHPDPRTQSRQFKWGLTQLVDMCGRPAMPASAPSAPPSRG
jgi:hypothetical protein